MEYPIVMEQDSEAGGYVVYCPTLKGCVSQGETEEEALENIKDAIKTYLLSIEDLKRLKNHHSSPSHHQTRHIETDPGSR